MAKRGKKVSGCDYAADDEEYDKKMEKKMARGMKTAGIAKELKLSQKQKGYSSLPRLKSQSKTGKAGKKKSKAY